LNKGIGPLAAGLVVMLGIILIGGTILVSLAFRMEFFQRTAKETEIINAINKMEFLKRNLINALDYSFYQAVYSSARKGGYVSLKEKTFNCIPYWREYEKTNYPRFKKNVQKLLLRIFNLYASRLADEINVPTFENIEIKEKTFEIKKCEGTPVACEDFYIKNECENQKGCEWAVSPIGMPPLCKGEPWPCEVFSYDECSEQKGCYPIEKHKEGIEIKVSAKGKISFITSFFKILEKAEIVIKFFGDFFQVYEVGKNNFIDYDKIKDAIISAINNLPERCKKIEINESCELPDARQIHSENCEDWKNILENNIRNNIFEIERTDEISVKIDIEDIKTSYSGNCDYSSEPSLTCGIKFCINETDTYDCECSPEPCCENFTNITYCLAYQNITCRYNYFGASKVLIKIIDNSKKYPVWDPEEKTTNYRNISLRFRVVSGNRKLIEPIMDESCRCEADVDCGECGFDECEGYYLCDIKSNLCTFSCNSFGNNCNWIQCNSEYGYYCGSCDLAGECQVGRGCYGAEGQCCIEGKTCQPNLKCVNNVCQK
jgi:hypothetical protein